MNYQNYQNEMLLSTLDTRRTLMHASILVYKHRPERTGFYMYTENTQQQLTFLALLPWFRVNLRKSVNYNIHATSVYIC